MIGVHADHQQLRNHLVNKLQESGHVSSERVASAFRTIPRHMFVPGVEPARAYRDEPLVIKSDALGIPISSSSQPAIMARMLEQLDVHPGHRVLEIGTGSGYNAALLAHLVGGTGTVVSVDIDDDLVDDARARLADCGVSRVTVGCGDGGLGWTEHAPYDRIIATAALTHPGADVPSGIRATADEISDGLSLWLALHEPAMAWVSSIDAAADRALNLGVYYAVRKPVSLGVAALVDADSLAALVRLDDEQPFELGALPLGPAGHRIAQRLVEHIHDWDTRGRPSTAGLRVSAYPLDTDPGAISEPGSVIDKRYNRLALTWAAP